MYTGRHKLTSLVHICDVSAFQKGIFTANLNVHTGRHKLVWPVFLLSDWNVQLKRPLDFIETIQMYTDRHIAQVFICSFSKRSTGLANNLDAQRSPLPVFLALEILKSKDWHWHKTNIYRSSSKLHMLGMLGKTHRCIVTEQTNDS